MNLYGYEFQRESDLMHYGVLGMKWGIRRYQNPDGTLTTAGKRRYGFFGKNSKYTVFEDFYGQDEADRLNNAKEQKERFDKIPYSSSQYTINVYNHNERYERGLMQKVLQSLPDSKIDIVTLYNGESIIRSSPSNMEKAAKEMYYSGELKQDQYEQVLKLIAEECQLYEQIMFDSVALQFSNDLKNKLVNEVANAEFDYKKTPKYLLDTTVNNAKSIFKKGIDFVSSLFTNKNNIDKKETASKISTSIKEVASKAITGVKEIISEVKFTGVDTSKAKSAFSSLISKFKRR